MNSTGTHQSTPFTDAWPLGQLAANELLALHHAFPSRYPYLLESSASSLEGNDQDFLLSFPQAQLNLYARRGLSIPPELSDTRGDDFLAVLDQWWQRERVQEVSHPYKFCGGWFLYLSYELAGQIEPSLKACIPFEEDQLIAQAVRVPAAIIRDSHSTNSYFVCESTATGELKLQILKSDLQSVRATLGPNSAEECRLNLSAFEEEEPQQFIDVVKQTQSHIAAGNIYQANLSRGWQAYTLSDDASAAVLYKRLKAANPSPYAGLVRLESDHYVISSSPERLIEVRHGWVSTRPIAGTRPRHTDARIDQSLIEELQAHPKERAEHIMLLDLERNDLGRICVAGTVQVSEYMSIESYRHVHHIVSNVRGRQSPDVTPGQTIAAVFPGGTITGCPKVRCMEIIASLEPQARGAYTGSMGYLNRDGSMDLNILIRTLEMQGNRVRFRAGAGIVADSIPERELEETRAKALGLLRILKD